WRDDVRGAAIQAQDPRPALTVDAADDRELLDEKAVVVIAVDRVEELPWHGIHVAGDGEQPDPVALSPELAPNSLGHDIGPQLRAEVPDPVADEGRAGEPGLVRRHRPELFDERPDHLGRIACQAPGDFHRVPRLAD